MLRTNSILFYTSISLLFSPVTGSARSGGPDDNLAGNPPGRQTCVGCHSTFALNSGQGSLRLENLPETYQPGETYRLTLALADPNARRCGFELTSIDADNNKAGALGLVNQQNTQLSGGVGNRPQFIKHTRGGTAAGQANGNSWEFEWTAPNADVGPVTFYFAGNAANNNGGTDGDRIYAASQSIEAEPPPPPPPPPDSLVISLATGWNFVSSSVIPHSLDLDSVFTGLLRGGRLELVRNATGTVFDPVNGVDQIGEWNPTSAYQVKMSDRDRLVFFGEFADPSVPVMLNNGWNWIGYSRMDTINPNLVLQQLGFQALLIKDGNGRFAVPEANLSNLGWMTPGSGLMVQMELDQPREFVWPEPSEAGEVPPDPSTPSHFHSVPNTGHSMNVVLSEWNVRGQLSAGDEISVKCGSDVIAGTAVVREGMTFLTVWGDDNTTEQIDGVVAESNLVFTYWFADADSEAVLIATRNDGLPVTYSTDTWAAIALSSPEPNSVGNEPFVTPLRFRLNGVYPNPFNPTAEVAFTLAKAGTARITLWNNAGRVVKELGSAELEAGEHRFILEGAGLPAGVYLVSVTADRETLSTKALLLK